MDWPHEFCLAEAMREFTSQLPGKRVQIIADGVVCATMRVDCANFTLKDYANQNYELQGKLEEVVEGTDPQRIFRIQIDANTKIRILID